MFDQPAFKPRAAARKAEGSKDPQWHRWKKRQDNAQRANTERQPAGGKIERAAHPHWLQAIARVDKGFAVPERPAMPDAAPEPIVVTGQALPDAAGDRLLGVVTITDEELRRSASRQMDEVIRTVAGVQLFRRSDARSAHPTSQGITMRGLAGNGASRVLVLLDGVPQLDPFGGWVPWTAVDPLSLGAVRVTRGGGSVAQGPGALAGVIELTSASEPGLAATVDLGSREAVDARVAWRTSLGGGLLSVSAAAIRGDGFVPVARRWRGPADRRAPYRNASARLRWAGPVARDAELQAAFGAFRDERERGLAFTDNRTQGVDGSLRLIGRGRWGWSLLGYAQRRGFESSFAATDPDRTEARRTSLQYDVPGRAIGWSAEVRPPAPQGMEWRFGMDGRRAVGRSAELGSFVAGAATRDRLAGGRTLNGGAFAEATVTSGALTVSGAARWDRWHIAGGIFRDRNLATGALVADQKYPARSGWRPTARAAAGVELGQGWTVRSASYLGWRLPSLNELFRPFRAGSDATAANPLLDPERLSGMEAGIRWRTDTAAVELTAFSNRLRGAIANVTLGEGPGVFPGVGFVPAGGVYRQRQNLQAITTRGVELEGEIRHGPWAGRVSGSYADAEVQARGAGRPLNGLRPAQAPRLTAAASIAWDDEGRFGSLQARYVGAQFEDDLNSIRLPSALTFDAAAGLPLSRRWTLTLRAENLLDKQVAATISGSGVVERATPRTLWLGLALRP